MVGAIHFLEWAGVMDLVGVTALAGAILIMDLAGVAALAGAILIMDLAGVTDLAGVIVLAGAIQEIIGVMVMHTTTIIIPIIQAEEGLHTTMEQMEIDIKPNPTTIEEQIILITGGTLPIVQIEIVRNI